MTYAFWQFVWILGTHVSYPHGVLSICVSLTIPNFFQSSTFITGYLQALPTAFSFLAIAICPTRKKVLVIFRANNQLTFKSILFIFYNSLQLYVFQFNLELVLCTVCWQAYILFFSIHWKQTQNWMLLHSILSTLSEMLCLI